MPHYKLTYFDVRGLGEVIRQLFILADVPFEDHRVTVEEFVKMKPDLPSGQLPIFEVDGLELSQSAAIMRYLARKFGFAGKTPEEEAQADAVVDLFKEYMNNFRQYGFALLSGKSEEECEKIKSTIVKPAAAHYYACLNKILKKSTSGFLVGNSLTWADLQVADNLTTCINVGVFDEKEEEKLAEFHRKILETPKLREYLDTRKYMAI